MNRTVRMLTLMVSSLSAPWLTAQTLAPCPTNAPHADSSAHRAMVEHHGDQAMGFAHDKTTHHFRLFADGGAIEVTANDPADAGSRVAVRTHLVHITKSFADGDYSVPMFVHNNIPPGVTAMKLLKERIHFEYHPIDSGGRIKITSDDPVALAAIHDFLRFQITDHGTGDPLQSSDAH